MLQAGPCFFNGAGLTPSDVAELRHPVTARRCSGLVKDQELNVEICSVFPILFAVHPEVGADVVVGGYLLPPAGNCRMLEAEAFAGNRDQSAADPYATNRTLTLTQPVSAVVP